MKLIHVLRDGACRSPLSAGGQTAHVVARPGHDVGSGKNQAQYRSLCPSIVFPPGSPSCVRLSQAGNASAIASTITFWSSVNLQAYSWARAHLGPERYFVIRVEDLVLGPHASRVEATRRIANFLGLPAGVRTDAHLVNATALLAGHEHSYGGARFNASTRANLLQLVGSAGHAALEFFGYQPSDWGTSGRGVQPPYPPAPVG